MGFSIISVSIMHRNFALFPKILRKHSLKSHIRFKINQTQALLFCSHPCQHTVDSSLLESKEVQQYLNFIKNDQSIIKEFLGSNSEQIHKVCSLLDSCKEIEKEIESLNNMPSDGDKELEKLMKEEKQNYLKDLKNIDVEVLSNLIVSNQSDECRAVEVQIIPAVGGDEAKLFAEELYQMYLNYIAFKNWECLFSELKGQKFDLRSANLLVSGYLAYLFFKNEAGVHRVQRVPLTEKHGKTHTSTCSIVVLPQPNENEIVINPKDLIIETTLSGGPGGQNVQKNETCVRIKHIPTGISVENQTSRFQYENKELAIKKLRGILFNLEQEKLLLERKSLKKKQIGTNDYSDKIRTYNFNQNRITDHRINFSSYNSKAFMSGGKELDEMISKLVDFNKKRDLFDHIDQVLQSEKYKKFSKSRMSN